MVKASGTGCTCTMAVNSVLHSTVAVATTAKPPSTGRRSDTRRLVVPSINLARVCRQRAGANVTQCGGCRADAHVCLLPREQWGHSRHVTHS